MTLVAITGTPGTGKTSVSANATLHVDAEGTRSLTFFHKGVQFSWTW